MEWVETVGKTVEEAVEAARFDPEVELVDGAKLAEVARQVGGFDGWVHGTESRVRLPDKGRKGNLL